MVMSAQNPTQGTAMSDIPDEFCGPAMLALGTERLRKFAFYMGGGLMSGAEAAREAGYWTRTMDASVARTLCCSKKM
jgi:hypothetical protein